MSDDTSDNPFVVRAGLHAELLWRRSLEYCNRNLTDGFIPVGKVRLLADWHGLYEEISDGRLISSTDPVDVMRLAERLVREGLWEKVEGGYQVNDVNGQQLVPYLDHQPSAREVRRDRRRAREQRSQAGRASAQKRSTKRSTGAQRDGQRNGNGSANEIATGAQRDG